jgi:putative peptide zinc metalloprotease protein
MNPADQQSAAARPIALRKRRDLVVCPQRWGGRKILAVKDPLALRYYHLREEEFFILQQLDGGTSPEQIQAAFERTFAPQKLRLTTLVSFLGMLHGEHLVISDAAGQDRPLLERRGAGRRREWLAAWSNPLALRFRGVDPERFLAWLHPRLSWLFSPWLLAASLLLILVAAGWVGLRFEQLQSRLPEFSAFFSPENLVWFAVAIALAKVLHELAHALACKHFGGECHELGVMLLVFTPCLFVNVSDSWMLPERWKRIAVAAAGIWVELTLAAVCTFVWWFTNEGLLNSVCLKLMFVSSVGTVLFNANPLLPYDGYYILSDLWGVPNLRERSSRLLRQLLARWFLGLDTPAQRLDPETGRGWLLAYAVASLMYRLFILAVILWFLHGVLRPHGLQVVAQLLTVLVVSWLLAGPVCRAVRFWTVPSWRSQMQTRRWWWRMAVCAAGLILLLTVPLPYRVQGPVVVEPQGARRVFVSTAGQLRWAVEPGSEVRRGDRLAELDNPALTREITALVGRRQVLETELENLRRRGAQQIHRGTGNAGSLVPAAEAALDDVVQQIAQRETQQQQLVIRAPCDGIVMPPPSRRDAAAEGQLPVWQGEPLEASNRGAWLAAGTLLCLVGTPERVQGLLIVDQSELPYLRVNQTVYLQLEQLGGGYLAGEISEVAEADLDHVPEELLAARRLPVHATPDGTPRLAGNFYQAIVAVHAQSPPLTPGGIGRARVVAAPQPLSRRIARFLHQTFRLSVP